MEVFALQQRLQSSQVSPVIQVKNLKGSRSSSPVKIDTKLMTPKKACNDQDVVVVEPSSKTPNKLSEELVRCMAAIYCKLADPPLPELSPFSPGSSSSASSPTTHESSHEFSNSNDSWSPLWRTDNTSCEMINGCIFPDPYSVKDVGSEDVGPYSSMVEVPWICVDKDRLTYAARALQNFR
jgi:hypothetical protein